MQYGTSRSRVLRLVRPILMSACHDGLVDTPHHATERADWKAAIALRQGRCSSTGFTGAIGAGGRFGRGANAPFRVR